MVVKFLSCDLAAQNLTHR